jgi:hypothetical protein
MARRHLVLLTAAAIGLSSLAVASSATAADGGKPLGTTLSGAAEVPGPGDPDGSGTATLRIKPSKGQICYTLDVHDIAQATAAHIHVGDAGVAGPVVVPRPAVDRDVVRVCRGGP